MFKIILLVTTFGVGGHVTRVPLDSYPKPFPTVEACTGIFKSDNFNAEVKALGLAIAAQGHSNTISWGCVIADDSRRTPAPEGANRG
jgi:hypothetical protein